MSPHIEWHVGEDAEQETIIQTTPARRSPRRPWIVISAIGLGVVLGLLYQSIPEPPRKPPIGSVPIPTVIALPSPPPPTPESLDAAVERDALRLASSAGEANHLIAFAAPGGKFADWYAALQNAFGRWGTPPAPALYTVSVSGTLPGGGAWVTLRQYRHGAVYHSTRFYRLENDRWVWTLPDREFWSGATSTITMRPASSLLPITVQYPIEDTSLISPVLDRFSSVYQNLCVSLKCPTPNDQSPSWTLGLTVSLTITPLFIQPVAHMRSGTLQIDLPSPNVVGVYDEANALGDPYVAMAYDTLINPTVRLASGDYARWDTNSDGSLFLQAIATWKQARLPSNLYLLDVFYQSTILPPSVDMSPSGWLVSRRDFYVNQLRDVKLIPLTDLWTWPTAGKAPATLDPAAMQEAKAVIIYIEERYGPGGVVRFLNSLGKARSLEAAIKTSLPIEYAEFEQQWNTWIAGN